MKKLVFLFTFVAAMIIFASPVHAQERGMVSVAGEGIVSVTPDVAHIFIGVENQEAQAHTAQQRNNAIMSDVLAAIKAKGVDEADIQTTRFNMWPVHSWDPITNLSSVTGYSVSNNISITVRDVDLVGEILSAASQAGANMASSVSFGVLDHAEAYNQALALAVADAAEKARVIATSLGQTLGPVLSVHEASGFGGFFPPTPVVRADMAMEMSFAGGGVPVQGGELAVIARVQITYELR